MGQGILPLGELDGRPSFARGGVLSDHGRVPACLQGAAAPAGHHVGGLDYRDVKIFVLDDGKPKFEARAASFGLECEEKIGLGGRKGSVCFSLGGA